jgi:hypothetical protein
MARRTTIQTYTIDADTTAFMTAASITDTTITYAINELVIRLKAFGLWNKMKAIYPFVGGTASTHIWNLKDPRNLNAAFRLQFNGSWTHSANGALPNGVNAFANTFFVPSVQQTISSAHFAKYNTNNDTVGNKIDGVIGDTNTNFVQMNYSAGNGIIGPIGTLASYTVDNTIGLFTSTRTSSNLMKVFRRGTEVVSNTTTITALASASVFIGARQNNNTGTASFFNPYEAAFASLGDGLTDSDNANLDNIVVHFQTILGR